jgi:hypothetical protein
MWLPRFSREDETVKRFRVTGREAPPQYAGDLQRAETFLEIAKKMGLNAHIEEWDDQVQAYYPVEVEDV